ncbi:MAG: hypothetical protein AAF628_11995 [Planctomycetota bacterium]
MVVRRHAFLPVLLVAVGAPAAQDPAPRHLAPEHLLDWERASAPRLAPTGDRLVFTRSWVDKVADRWRSELWLARRDGTRPRFLTEGSGARWSPDGTRVGFLREGKPRGSQIHVMWLDTREVTQITRVDESPGDLRWSPDGTRLAFSMNVPESQRVLKIDLPKAPKGAKWAEEPKIITRLSYRRDGSGYRPQGWRHLFVVDAEGGTPRQVTTGDFDHRRPEWSPDGAKLWFSGLRRDDADWQVRESEI